MLLFQTINKQINIERALSHCRHTSCLKRKRINFFLYITKQITKSIEVSGTSLKFSYNKPFVKFCISVSFSWKLLHENKVGKFWANLFMIRPDCFYVLLYFLLTTVLPLFITLLWSFLPKKLSRLNPHLNKPHFLDSIIRVLLLFYSSFVIS